MSASVTMRLTTRCLILILTLLLMKQVEEIRSESVSLFETLSLTIVRAHSNRNKPPSGSRRSPRAPDLYINVMAQQKGTDGSDTGKEMFIGKTKVVKNNHRPVFNETFKYQRDQASPYTIGTDGLLRIHLYDQMPGLMTADQDLGYFDIPLGAIVEDEKSGVEMMGQMELGQSKSHVAYKVDYKIDPIGTREDGGGIDDDFVFGNDPVVKKSSKG